VEEESKMSFFKRLKISIFGLEKYHELAVSKVSKAIKYIIILMLIFAFFLGTTITYRFSQTVKSLKTYIETNIEVLEFKDGKLNINSDGPITIVEDKLLNGKIIIDTNQIDEKQANDYIEDIKSYYNGIAILQDKIVLKSSMTTIPTTIYLADIANQYNIVKLEKQDILAFLSDESIYITFFVIVFIYLFIIYFTTVLVDAILYSLIGYITGIMSGLKMAYRSVYNIAIYSLTLPIILNLIYIIINILTGYTIKYFSIMYTAITCIYIITAILIIKSDLIKKQLELSKIIQEQEKVRQKIQRKELERKEEEEREKIRRKDEEKRKKEKEESSNDKKDKDEPQPQANIKPNDI